MLGNVKGWIARNLRKAWDWILGAPVNLWTWMQEPRQGDKRYDHWLWVLGALFVLVEATLSFLEWRSSNRSNILAAKGLELAVKQLCSTEVGHFCIGETITLNHAAASRRRR